MRIVVVGPPEAGGVWVACLLAKAFGLRVLPPRDGLRQPDLGGFAAWMDAGGFPDGAVLHRNLRFSPEVPRIVEAAGVRIVAAVRDPYDVFVAMHRAAQEGPARAGARPLGVLAGKAIDDPAVVEFLARGFRSHLVKTDEWRRSGRAVVVRHEDLVRDPDAALAAVGRQLGIPGAGIDGAAAHCAVHAPAAVGGELLSDEHLALFRSRHAHFVEDAGYVVRAPIEAPATSASDDPAARDADLVPDPDWLGWSGTMDRRRWDYARKGGPANFLRVGAEMVARFADEGGLSPDGRVLDVGCGVGRIAVGLAHYLSDLGSYEGFDVDADAIRWCRERITPRYPRFRFRVADVRNAHYRPDGAHDAATFRFPYADASFDLVVLVSVFTHMLPDDLDGYVREIERVLRPGGRCFATMFLLNERTRADIAAGRSMRRFPFDRGTYRTNSELAPELSVAYDEDQARARFAAGGLAIAEPIRFGAWSRTTDTGALVQDAIIAVKPDPARA